MLDKVDNLSKSKPDCLLIHVGTNDITNNLLYIRKDKKDVTTKLDEINFVDDNNITEDQLRSKKSER